MRARTFLSSFKRVWIIGLLLLVTLIFSLAFLVVNGRQNLHQTNPAGSPVPTTLATGGPGSIGPGISTPSAVGGAIHHYEYVFPDGRMYVYDMDNGHRLVKSISLPTTTGVRGVVASPATHMLYVSYGGDGGSNGNGSMLKYDLVADKVVRTKSYSHGIDSMAISPGGETIYMPDGELSPDGVWYVIDASSGNEIGTINGGLGPHNTIVSPDGTHVYLGGRNHNYLEVADTTTHQVIKNIGPLMSGVRPFTINGTETLAYISVTSFLGFQVGDIATGRVLYTVPIHGFSWDGSGPSDPSHGVSLSPDGKELYVLDWPNNYVHVFDVSGVPASPPRQVADIRLSRSMHHQEFPCAYDCLADGWLQHSRDGRFVYVGDEGDVIDTATRKSVGNLPTLYNTRKMIEIDWQNGVPIFSPTSRSGVGYAANPGSIAHTPTSSPKGSTFPTGVAFPPFVVYQPTDTPTLTGCRIRPIVCARFTTSVGTRRIAPAVAPRFMVSTSLC
jgi:DNA-binding beta-propeller fold protein YncE